MKIKSTKSLLIILVSLITLITWNCKDRDDINLDYCKMLERDQSHVNSDRTDKAKFNLDRKKRQEIFKDNFKQIIQYSKLNGFPKMGSLKETGLDSCRNWVVMITLFHVGQSQPKLFFDKEAKQLLEKEIKEGRLRSGSLFPPLREGFRNHEFCLESKDDIYTALKAWQIKINELPEIKFVECVK